MKRIKKQQAPPSSKLAGLKRVLLRNDRRQYALGCPLTGLRENITPNHLHYVLNRFPIPNLNLSKWTLRVYGHVKKPLLLTYEDLMDVPPKTLTVTLECAGNGRALYHPPAPFINVHWTHHAVSNARWKGVPLEQILRTAGVESGSKEVIFKGADHGIEDAVGRKLRYERSLPLDVALHPDTLLAYQVTGETLPRIHGFPLRLVVPGWYGMASVKWLTEIKLIDKPFKGFYQAERYVYEWTDKPDTKIPVTQMRVKSLITEPLDGEDLRRGKIVVKGIAWTGEARVKKVEVSTDGGLSWDVAYTVTRSGLYGWSQWEYHWKVSEAGVFVVMARAIDNLGNTQPCRARWNRQGIGNNSIHTINVKVS